MDDAFPATGLFVPKPGRGAGCQRHGIPDLQSTVRQRPLASLAGGADRYSVGYSPSPWTRSAHSCRSRQSTIATVAAWIISELPLRADENVEDHFIRRRDLAMAVMPRVLGQLKQIEVSRCLRFTQDRFHQ